MAEISLPLDMMRESARKITSETQELASRVEDSWQSIQRHLNALPGPVHARFEQLAPLRKQLQDLLAARQQLGERLAAAADDAQSVDAWIAQRF